MRDLETIAIAIETAETGPLVFGTLHTSTAASTVDRIIDQFPADRQSQIRVMLSESLKGVIAQTLCKKLGGGRVAAREILLTTPAIANLIREGKTFQIPSIIQTSKQLGMLTLNDALLDLVAKKEISPDEAYRKSVAQAERAASLGAARSLQEMQIAPRLHHPHILPLYDSDEADGLLYYVMPYVEGESLRERLARERQLPVDEALQIAREVADALSYAHSCGVVHRDIKPANILQDAGHAVVADFGIARAIGVASAQSLTGPRVIGTLAYMSPEQAEGSQYLDGRSDLYSLGCVLFEMLVGQPPFAGNTLEAVIANRVSSPIGSLRAGRELVPEAVDAAGGEGTGPPPAHPFLSAP